MKAVFLDFATLGPDLNVSAMQALLPQLELHDMTDSAQLGARLQGAEIVLTNKVRLNAPLFADNPSLKFIGLTATGTDNVDLQAAQQHGVAVCNIRDYCTQSVAEHVFGCLLNLTHNLGRYRETVAAGEWQKADNFCLMAHPIRELSGMTLGIVGYGALGNGVAKIAKAFGMTVIVSARPGSTEVQPGRVAFDDLLQQADVISLHCPLTASTQGLFGHREFRKMKRGAILINTARGGLIDSAALVAALNSQDIAAAVDVLPHEPPVDGDPLLDYKGHNLLVTPHIAWGTHEARQAAVDQLTECVAAFLNGETLNRVV